VEDRCVPALHGKGHCSVTVSGKLCVMAPEVALTIACTVAGVPAGAVAVGVFIEGEQPPIARVMHTAMAIIKSRAASRSACEDRPVR